MHCTSRAQNSNFGSNSASMLFSITHTNLWAEDISFLTVLAMKLQSPRYMYSMCLLKQIKSINKSTAKIIISANKSTLVMTPADEYWFECKQNKNLFEESYVKKMENCRGDHFLVLEHVIFSWFWFFGMYLNRVQ